MSRRLTCRLLSMMVPFLISGDPLLVPTHVQKAHLPVAVHDGTVSDLRRPTARAHACACPC
eukprot:12655097-Prorocentrum_lima.AAC.1